MSTSASHFQNSVRRRNRVRAGLANNQSTPRLTVFRSLRHIYAQIIDDINGKTLASASDFSVKTTGNKTDIAIAVGAAVAELAKAQKIESVRFDRGSYKYHGRVAALADGARKAGLKF